MSPPSAPDVSDRPFDRATFESAPRQLLRDGRWANARVYRVEAAGGCWVVKDFSARSFWVRHSVGRLLLGREVRTLRRLAGIEGVPQRPFRIDRSAVAAEFIPGVTLGQVPPEQIAPSFFAELERLLAAVHARGIVHLDARGTGNVIMQPDGSPALIDFQAALRTDRLPVRWRRLLEDLDMTGVYKKWLRHSPDTMGPARRALLERMNRVRRFWIFRGYAGATKQKASRPTSPQ